MAFLHDLRNFHGDWPRHLRLVNSNLVGNPKLLEYLLELFKGLSIFAVRNEDVSLTWCWRLSLWSRRRCGLFLVSLCYCCFFFSFLRLAFGRRARGLTLENYIQSSLKLLDYAYQLAILRNEVTALLAAVARYLEVTL